MKLVIVIYKGGGTGGSLEAQPPQSNDLLITTINYYGCSLLKNTWLSSVLLSLYSLKKQRLEAGDQEIESVGLGDKSSESSDYDSCGFESIFVINHY